MPYAGGGATAYWSWRRGFPAAIDLQPLKVPGRDGQAGEPAEAPSVPEIAAAVACRARGPYALYGHSMGARLSFEVVRELRRTGAPMPVRLFVGAALPPHLPEPLARLANLPEADFIEQLIDRAGAPPDLRHEPELRALALPALRADFAWIRAYRYRPEPALDVPVTAFAGSDDREFPPAKMAGWARHTTAGFRLHTLAGGHMFLHGQAERMAAIIAADLTGGSGRAPGPPEDDEVHVWLATRPEILRRYDGARPGLRIGAAESGGLTVTAVTRGLRAGIAVERLPPPEGVDESLFDPAERADLDAEPAETRLLSAVSIHVAKKAVLRAAGNAPACDPAGFGFVRRDAGEPWRPGAAPGMERLEAWRVTHFPVPGGLAAVAVARDGWRLRFEIPGEAR
ncbi:MULTISPECIES: thioesterase domain-containing protein [unclassified Spirillospora]|uniref:thioesterase domain-containing protein n=1 Tax=unclassified Spirillospora TaxID=2642701 RepID=UPI00371A9B7E